MFFSIKSNMIDKNVRVKDIFVTFYFQQEKSSHFLLQTLIGIFARQNKVLDFQSLSFGHKPWNS